MEHTQIFKLAKGSKTRSTVQVICHTIDEHLKNMIFAATTLTPAMESATAQTVGKVVLHAFGTRSVYLKCIYMTMTDMLVCMAGII